MKNKLLVTILLMVVLSSLVVVKTFATETGGEAGTGETGGTGTTEEWTDFSKAKYEMKIERISGANRPVLDIKNVTLKSNHNYFYAITKNKTDVLELSDMKQPINKDNLRIYIDDYYELSGDMYLWIKEYNPDIPGIKTEEKEKLLVSGQKLERVDNNPQYVKAFKSTFIAGDEYIINLDYCKADKTNRKVNIKVGKINDQALLRKIKNNESGAWEKLLQYAKTSDAIVNKNLTSTDYVFGFTHNKNEKLGISNSEIEDGAYYYLYVDVDSENGKYYPVGPAVTLAIAGKVWDEFYMFFYGTDDFKWELSEEQPAAEEEPAKEQPKEEEKKDETIAKEKMPNTGLTYIVTLAIGTVTVLGAIAYKKHNNLRGI